MRRSLVVLALAACVGCQQQTPPEQQVARPEPAAPPPQQEPAATRPHVPSAAITAEDFAAHVKILSSDDYEGRAPGSLGERLTTTYVKSEFERMGLKPGNNGSFFQSVPMMETTVDPATTLRLEVGGAKQVLAMGTDMVVGSRQNKPEVAVVDSGLVFVGYGVKAPEYDWNDYAGLDVKGKTVIVLVNDPGFLRKDPALFKGPAMTYYGRWTYKFEEAARQGAAGALIVHDTDAAAYGWDVVRNSLSGAQFDLAPTEDAEPRLQFEGWLSADAAAKLFGAAKQDLEALRMSADQRGFTSLELGAKLSTRINSTIRAKSSDNVLAVLPGASTPEETVVYMAHWDHLGKHDNEPGDNIYNGAIDNATGVAGVLEIAEAFTHQDPRPARSVLFFLPTLEESGLIGSRYYVNHPVVPLDKTVAAINMDALRVRGPSRDLVVVGHGQSELEDLLAEAIKAQDRIIVAEPTPEKGYYFRSDHFNFAKKGVPSLYPKTGYDLREGGPIAGHADENAYVDDRYHKPGDAFDPNWNFAGAIEDVAALYEVGKRVAAGDVTPNWRESSEFKAARAEQ